MKPSFYNFFFEHNNKHFVFNAKTGALLELEREEWEGLRKGIWDGKEGILRKHGIIVEDDVDELQELKKAFEEAKRDKSVSWITIALTSSCNFACIYCYERGRKEQNLEFNYQLFDAALDYIREKTKEAKKVILTAYGGEPLLRERLLQKVLDLAKEFKETGKKVEVHIITNGYFLEKLPPSQLISLIQITLDGPPPIHNKRRILKDGGKTFEKIYNNLKALVENVKRGETKAIIEINIVMDKQNVSYMQKIIDLLARDGILFEPFVKINFSPTMPTTFYDPGLTPQEISKEVEHLKRYIFEKYGLKNKVMLEYPSPKMLYCGALKQSTLVIDPLGFVYRCWDDVFDPKNAIDHVYPQLRKLYKKRFEENLAFYESFDPTQIEPCKHCKSLPLCMGGCMSARKRLKMECAVFEGAQVKYALIDMLKNYLNGLDGK